MLLDLFDGINKADVNICSGFYNHILLSGGTTMYLGLPSKLEKEIKKLDLERVAKGKKEVLAKFLRRKHMVFLNGAVLVEIIKDKPPFLDELP